MADQASRAEQSTVSGPRAAPRTSGKSPRKRNTNKSPASKPPPTKRAKKSGEEVSTAATATLELRELRGRSRGRNRPQTANAAGASTSRPSSSSTKASDTATKPNPTKNRKASPGPNPDTRAGKNRSTSRLSLRSNSSSFGNLTSETAESHTTATTTKTTRKKIFHTKEPGGKKPAASVSFTARTSLDHSEPTTSRNSYPLDSISHRYPLRNRSVKIDDIELNNATDQSRATSNSGEGSSFNSNLVSRLSQFGRRAVPSKKKKTPTKSPTGPKVPKATVEGNSGGTTSGSKSVGNDQTGRKVDKFNDSNPSTSSASASTSKRSGKVGALASTTTSESKFFRTSVVLKRNTRSTKATVTTGSCTSSSSASGSGSGNSANAAAGSTLETRGRATTRKSRQSKSSMSTPLQDNPPATTSASSTSQQAARTAPSDGAEMPSTGQDNAQSTSASAQPSAAHDSEAEDSEVGRLQALLEARGLPPHLFGALGPRMQQFLHRSMGATTSSRVQTLLQGLQATGDEGQQLQAVIEMCQVLVMGNEDTLSGFPIKQVVPALISLLNMDHNFDMMNHACRALTYMMEALPRSSSVVVDAVPAFLEKLQVIQCMDVAEQSLTALDMLSRRHGKSILQARGVSACLMYLDFFSTNAQRAALSITANCCQSLSHDEFPLVSGSLPLLAEKLVQHDRRSVESVCLAFSRLTDSMQNDPIKLREIASPALLTNMQQLLVVSPPVISTNTFISVLRMLSLVCTNCPDLALQLLRQNISVTLWYLLTGSAASNDNADVELASRSPQELYEITCLIGELMPRLPTDGIFSVDLWLQRQNMVDDTAIWFWRDNRGQWCQYPLVDSRIVESAHLSGEDEVSLNTMGRTYTIDFHTMQQINEDSGTTRPIQRRFVSAAALVQQQTAPNQDVAGTSSNANVDLTKRDFNNTLDNRSEEERELIASFIQSLFSILYEVYSSSAGPAVRGRCLRALLRMVYYADADLLRQVLKNQLVSSHLAGMMASNDLRIVVGALQMANILMLKLPNEFGVHFRREGVMFQVSQLADPQIPFGNSPPKSASSECSSQARPPSMISLNSSYSTLMNLSTNKPTVFNVSNASTVASSCQTPQPGHSSGSKNTTGASEASPAGRSTPTGATSTPRSKISSINKTGSFLASLNPVRWGRSLNSSCNASQSSSYRGDNASNSSLAKSLSQHNLTSGHREKARQWVREQSSKFLETYSVKTGSDNHPAFNVLTRLKNAIDKMFSHNHVHALVELRDILIDSDISPFEVNHSGLIKSLLSFLADVQGVVERNERLRAFLHVFAALPLKKDDCIDPNTFNSMFMSTIVAKLNGCVSQLEQFPVKVHDLPAGTGRSGNTSALKFFNTHQLKCNLQRHPDCNNLKQWKGGTVKIDPLALVQAIERYLVVRGYGRIRDKETGDSDDDNTDEDLDDTLAAVVINQGGSKHRLQFLIGSHVLPYNMTVYQAVKQFSTSAVTSDQSETDTDSEMPLGNADVWVQTHTIYYRPLLEEPVPDAGTGKNSAVSSTSFTNMTGSDRKGSGKSSSSKSSHRRKCDELWNDGAAPAPQPLLSSYLATKLPDTVTVQDASLDVLCLLRIMNALNRFWHSLYMGVSQRLIIPQTEFINSKLAAKANRQLQDPLVIMTGNLPSWLSQIASVCQFLFPFETRQLLFYAISFDRDRALQRLLDTTPELTSTDSQERVTPRLDRRKRTICREDILRQAEQVIMDTSNPKALLEVSYASEVGTGLGPTLEFYALVSREFQRQDLELWKCDSDAGKDVVYVKSNSGLFPAPMGRTAKVTQISKVRSKFKFLGKFIAKAVMDSRMLDLQFSLAFHRWLLGEESSLSMADLAHVAPEIHRYLSQLQMIVRDRDNIMSSLHLNDDEKMKQCQQLTMDDCQIEDLGLEFVLPGFQTIELKRGGRNLPVTVHNLHEYLRLVTYWFLNEGVNRQMEALKEGFELVFPLRQLSMFYPEELEAVFCGSSQSGDVGWDVRTLQECCRPDHGYVSDSRAIRYLFEILSGYNKEEQRLFVQFVTGSPRLPVGGFRSLTPPLTIVRKAFDQNVSPDDYLPSVMTCVNYLKLPDYSSLEVMREKLRIAANEGQHSFHLS